MDEDFGVNPPEQGELFGVQQYLIDLQPEDRALLTGMDVGVMLREAYDIDYGIVDHNVTAQDSMSHVLMNSKENIIESSSYHLELLTFSQLELGDIIHGSWWDYLKLDYATASYVKLMAQDKFYKKQSKLAGVDKKLNS